MCRQVLNFSFDLFFSTVIVLNQVVFVWRIIWDTQDNYLQSDVLLNSLVSLLSSFLVLLVIKLVQINYVIGKKKSQISMSKFKALTLVFAFANITMWRGFWNFTTFYTQNSNVGICMLGLLSVIGLLAMNRLCALVSLPFFFGKDTLDSMYKIDPENSEQALYKRLNESMV